MRRVIAALIAALAQPGCGATTQAQGEPPCAELRLAGRPPGASAILVVNDAMRRDALAVHGGRARTPRFDRFARENLLFENAVAQAPWTKPSIATLFSSLYPSQHRVDSHPELRARPPASGLETDVLAAELTTLAETLQRAGLRTAAFVANPWLAEGFGFEQGFERYDASFARWGAPGDAAARAALAWLRGLAPGERFFLYLHLVESHRPYGAIPASALGELGPGGAGRAPIRNADGSDANLDALVRLEDGRSLREAGLPLTRALLRAAYRSGVEAFDRVLGSLLDGLGEGDAWDRTAVIVTSDHGEALYARGYGNHGAGLYDDEIAIPLAARLPGVEPGRGRVRCLVGLVDVMPSLCAYLGAACPEGGAGWSFLRGPDAPAPSARRYLASEGLMSRPEHRAIRNRRYKLVYEPRGSRDGRPKQTPYSLFDLREDPAERADRLEAAPRSAETEHLFEALRPALAQAVAQRQPPAESTQPLDPNLVERLEELGYLRE